MCGYMHRGYEKLCEVRTYPQVTTLVNRIDWLGSFANEVPFILAAEQLMEVEAPPRAQWIRTLLFELSRIANISLFLGDLGLQLGAQTPAFYAFRDREFVLNQIESVTGGRFHPNFDRIGGLKDDLPKGWIAETKAAMVRLRDFCDEMEGLVFGNEIFQTRTRGIGVIPADVAQSYGLSRRQPPRLAASTGTSARDANVGLAYDQLDWKVWTHPDGDIFARCWVRLQEVREATKIVDQLCDGLPERPDHGQGPPHHQGARGRGVRRHREPARRDGLLRRLQGRLGPFRVKIRSASFNNISIVPWLLRGVYVPDIITILGQPLLHPRGHRPVIALVSVRRGPVVLAGRPRCGSSACCVAVILPAGAFVYLFLFKMMSFMQSRLGPMEAGPYGSMQLLAEVGKFLQKEDIVPERADRRALQAGAVHRRWPSTFLLVRGHAVRARRLLRQPRHRASSGARPCRRCRSSASSSPAGRRPTSTRCIGGLRAAGQLIAYELPMVLAVVGVVIQAGTLNLQGIVAAQAERRDLRLRRHRQPVHHHAVRRVRRSSSIATQAELTQTPFDMPVAESEIVAGYMTEYSGLRFLLFFIGEFATAGAFAAIAATLFLGGWYLPGRRRSTPTYMNVARAAGAVRQDACSSAS